MTNPHESSYPFDSKLKMSEMHLFKGPNRLRWVRDRAIAQVLLDIWINIEARDAKHVRRQTETQHWTEKEEATE